MGVGAHFFLGVVLGVSTPVLAEESESTEELLERARAANATMEFDQVIALTDEIIARGEAAAELMAETYLLHGSAMAIVRDSSDAEQPFRMLLRLRADFDMPPNTPPKILAVFRLVQVEERQIAEQVRKLKREEIIASLVLRGAPTGTFEGGRPIPFALRLRDPRGVVDGVRVLYRRGGAKAFSALALALNTEGAWAGKLPGEWTSSEEGFLAQYYVSTVDGRGEELLMVGGPDAPHSLSIAPGVLDDSALYERWSFWATLGTIAAVGATAAIAISIQSSKLPQSDYAVALP